MQSASLVPHLLALTALAAAAGPGVEVVVRVVPPTVKVRLEEKAPSAAASDSVDIAAQRGECESAQLWIRHPGEEISLRNVSVRFAPLAPATGPGPTFAAAHWSARQQGYVHCRRNENFIPSVEQSPSWQPDPLLRLDIPDGGSALGMNPIVILENLRVNLIGNLDTWYRVAGPHMQVYCEVTN
jgi:hypothetical protein